MKMGETLRLTASWIEHRNSKPIESRKNASNNVIAYLIKFIELYLIQLFNHYELM